MIYRIALSLLLSCAGHHAGAHAGHDGDSHPPIDIAADQAPIITGLAVNRNPDGGFTVTVTTQGFTFGPIDEAGGAGQKSGNWLGYGHLYINGTKLAVMKAPVLHIPELPFGPHDFKLVLSDTAHAEYAVKGRVIAAETAFTVN